MNAEALDTLRRMDACSEAVEWVATQPDPATAWARCERGDWMLWLLAHTGADRGTLVLAACDVAEEALRYVPAGEDRPARAISTARAWVRGEATVEEVRAAARAADRAAATVAAIAAHAAAYAAYAAAYAAHGREPAARADAAGAAATAAYAADDAARADARRASLARSADLVRARFPSPPELR